MVIPPKRNRTFKRRYDADLYKERNIIERFFNKLAASRPDTTSCSPTSWASSSSPLSQSGSNSLMITTAYAFLTLFCAGGDRASQLQDAVQDIDGNAHFGGATPAFAEAQPIADHLLDGTAVAEGPGSEVGVVGRILSIGGQGCPPELL